MVYAYDLWALMPTKDLYDSQMMLAAISAAKDMYEKADQEYKDFKKEYNDFLSPIAKDVDWHNKNVTGYVKDVVNNLYLNGIDPLRSAEGRAALRNAINSVDVGRIARNKQSAENAQTYLKNKAILEAAGKYDPDFEERYLGYNLDNFDSSKGIWNRLSPVESKSLKSLTESSYNNRTPHTLTEKDVTDFGIKYDPRAEYKGFTYKDLLDIANTIAPGLTGTVYADYFRDLAKQKLVQSGNNNPTQSQINEQLAKDIANSLIEYIVKPDPDYSRWDREETLRYRRLSLLLALQRANARNSSNGRGSGKKTERSEFDYNDFLTGSTAAYVLGKTSWGARIGVGGVSDYNPESAGMFMKSALQEIAENIYDYNRRVSPLSLNLRSNSLGVDGFNRIPSVLESLGNAVRKNIFNNTGMDIGNYQGNTAFITGPTTRPDRLLDAIVYDNKLHELNLLFLSQISMPYSEDNFAVGTGRKRDANNTSYILMNKTADKGRIYSADEVALTSAGVNRPADIPAAIAKTKLLRKHFEDEFVDGKTMMKSEGFVLGRVGEDGSHHILQRIRISNKENVPEKEEGDNVIPATFNFNNMYDEDEVIYYDMGVDTQESPDFNITGNANMDPLVTDQSLALDRAVLSKLGLSKNSVYSDESVPDIYSSYTNSDLFNYLINLGK